MRALELTTDLSFAVLALAALLAAMRRPERIRVDVALVFGALGGAALLQELPRSTNLAPPWLAALGSALLMALPFLLVRLVNAVEDVPRWLPAATAMASVVLAILVIAVQPVPPPLASVAVAYSIAGDLYAAAAFARRARLAIGITSRRMAAVALGCGLLAVVFAVGIAEQELPPEMPGALAARLVVALLSGGCFWAGFLTPGFLRRSWRLPALYGYLTNSRWEAGSDDAGATFDGATLERLLTAARQTTGGRRALLALEDPTAGDLYLWGSPSARLSREHGIIAEAIRARRTVFLRHVTPESLAGSIGALFPPDAAPRSAIVAPVIVGSGVVGALAVLADKGPIFLEDDLELVNFFAAEAAVLIRARRHRETAQELAALREADRLKDEFMAVVSHELRTPLTAITGYADILLRGISGPLNERQERHVRGIRDAAGRLLSLINDLLDVSKLEAGTLDLHLSSVDSREAIVRAVAGVRVIAGTKGIRIETGDEPSAAVRADEGRLQQILVNLLTNAVKFTPEGGTVSISARAEEGTSGPEVAFSVADTGVGIAPNDLKRVWDRFYQIDSSSSRRFGGAGLGLSIVRRLVELHGGTVAVTSSGPGRGSTFSVRLPAAAAAAAGGSTGRDEEAPLLAAAPSAGGPVLELDGSTVLVVEDDPDIAAVLRTYLEDDGFAVEIATNGEQALRQAREARPVAITLDVMLPKLDGWSVLNALKRDPLTGDIPVVVISIVDNKDFGVVLGAAEYLVKPIDQERLRSVVQRLAGRPRLAGGPILLVDDDPAIVDVLARTLEGDGWPVRTAYDGASALARVEAVRPRAIILDLMMPGVDGFEVVQALQERAQWRDIPVVVMTAKDLTEHDRERLAGHVQRIILKQALSVEVLQRQIAEALTAYREGRATSRLSPMAGVAPTCQE